jgi:UDP-2,4-diacetamido-2,4,6-trideoxy-beta-L-altropyranose hydrolase
MRVVFRVDASLQMGTGHVMRCLTLAQVLKENGANVEFICRKHEGNLIDKIRSNGLIVHELGLFEETEVDTSLAHSHWLGATQQQDADDCIEIFKAEKINWLVVDHYALDDLWQKRLKPYCKKLMVIDDLADRKHQCDILLDQTFGRQQEDYFELTPKECKILLGSQYALLRPEFSKSREYSLERRKKLRFEHLLVNMGGADPGNITGQVIEELQAANLSKDVMITIVMGRTAPHLKSVSSFASKLSYRSEVKIDVNNMAEIMANTDIAIGAGGSTTWERCCLGLPALLYVIADNQRAIAENLEKIGVVKIVKNLNQDLQVMTNNLSILRSMSKKSSMVCDGLGANRVAKYLQ